MLIDLVITLCLFLAKAEVRYVYKNMLIKKHVIIYFIVLLVSDNRTHFSSASKCLDLRWRLHCCKKHCGKFASRQRCCRKRSEALPWFPKYSQIWRQVSKYPAGCTKWPRFQAKSAKQEPPTKTVVPRPLKTLHFYERMKDCATTVSRAIFLF